MILQSPASSLSKSSSSSESNSTWTGGGVTFRFFSVASPSSSESSLSSMGFATAASLGASGASASSSSSLPRSGGVKTFGGAFFSCSQFQQLSANASKWFACESSRELRIHFALSVEQRNTFLPRTSFSPLFIIVAAVNAIATPCKAFCI